MLNVHHTHKVTPCSFHRLIYFFFFFFFSHSLILCRFERTIVNIEHIYKLIGFFGLQLTGIQFEVHLYLKQKPKYTSLKANIENCGFQISNFDLFYVIDENIEINL